MNAGSSLTLKENGRFTLNGDLYATATPNNAFSIRASDNSLGSFIYKGNYRFILSAIRFIGFNRDFSDTDWHLIGSPFDSEVNTISPDIATGLTNNDFTNAGLATYNNDFFNPSTTSEQTTGCENYNDKTATSQGLFVLEKGYSLQTIATGITSFSGFPANNSNNFNLGRFYIHTSANSL